MAEEDSKKSLTCSMGECIKSTQFPIPLPSPIPPSKEKPQALDSISFNQKIKTLRNPIIWMAGATLDLKLSGWHPVVEVGKLAGRKWRKSSDS